LIANQKMLMAISVPSGLRSCCVALVETDPRVASALIVEPAFLPLTVDEGWIV
jgi:hypothetical protein